MGRFSRWHTVRLQYSQIAKSQDPLYPLDEYAPKGSYDAQSRGQRQQANEPPGTAGAGGEAHAGGRGQIVIEDAERFVLSERDSLLVLILLESPPAPNARLRAAIAAMP